MKLSTLVALGALLTIVPPAGAQAPTDALLARAAGSRVKGAADAPVTIVELSDFQCPFCAEFALNTLPALDSAYVRTGKVRMIFLNFPLPNHGASWIAAEAAMCAGAQDAFWPMHDRLFQAQGEWAGSPAPHELFARYAREIGIDAAEFETCAARDLVAPLLAGDMMQAAGSGARATPTFVVNGEHVLSGSQPFEELRTLIERLLAGG